MQRGSEFLILNKRINAATVYSDINVVFFFPIKRPLAALLTSMHFKIEFKTNEDITISMNFITLIAARSCIQVLLNLKLSKTKNRMKAFFLYSHI